MKQIIILLFSVLLISCGTTKKVSRLDVTTSSTEQSIINHSTDFQQHESEKTIESETLDNESERTTTTTETTTVTEFSPPDSLGNQYKVSETTISKRTDETERKGSNGKRQTETNTMVNTGITDSMHIDQSATTDETFSATDEKERKAGIGGYLWAFGIGAIVIILVVFYLWFWRKSLKVL